MVFLKEFFWKFWFRKKSADDKIAVKILDLDQFGPISGRTFCLAWSWSITVCKGYQQTTQAVNESLVFKLTFLIFSWEILMTFLSSADLFSKSTFSKSSFRNTIRVSNRLDPDQTWHIVGPDLRPNCFKIHFFKKLFQEYYQSVQQFGSRSGLTYSQTWSWSKLFAKVISRQHKRLKSHWFSSWYF